jgi:hypothetical protein
MLHHILFLSFLFTLQIEAWSNGPFDRGESIAFQAESSQEKEKASGEYSEFYYMKGIQVSQSLCYVSNFCEPGEVLKSDTLKTSFLVMVTFNSDKPDSVLFNGLEGANVSPRFYSTLNKSIEQSAELSGTPAYCDSTLGCGYARIDGDTLEFSQYEPSFIYVGTGTLKNDRLTLHTQWIYRGNGMEYFLEGQKIVGIE